MTALLSKRKLLIGLAIAGAIVAGLIFLGYDPFGGEMGVIRHSKDYATRAEAYRDLIERVGLAEAQEELYHSGLPFDGDAHLLDHIAGEYAYDHEGLAGISECKPYFLYACYHAFFIKVMFAEGTEKLGELLKRCYALGGNAVAQCTHGIGHGLLAWLGYAKLPEALAYCEKLGEEDPHFPVYNCLDGVFMENIWAVHDGGIPSPDRWVREDDPAFPCDDPRLNKPDWQRACYANQPVLVYQKAKGAIAPVASFCAAAPEAVQATCFDGLARQLHPVAHGSVERANELCEEVGKVAGPDRTNDCIVSIAVAGYGVGDEEFGYKMCDLLTGKELAVICATYLQRTSVNAK